MAKNKYKYSIGKAVDANGNTWFMYDGQKYSSYAAAQAAASKAQLADQLFAGAGVSGRSGGPNWWRKMTGSGLTDAEIQQNQQNSLEAEQARQFNSEEAEKAWLRSEQSADNAMARQRELRQTAYQDTVEGAQAAGINPYFALGSGAAGSSSAPQGSAPAANGPAAGAGLPSAGGLADLLNLFRIKSEIAVNRSVAEKNKADAELAEKNAAFTGKQTDWYDIQQTAELVAKKASTDLTEAQTRQVDHIIDNLDANTFKLQVDAAKAVALTKYEQAVMESTTANNYAQAQLAVVQYAYQQRMLDEGAVHAYVNQMNAQAHYNDVMAQITGSQGGNITGNEEVDKVIRGIFSSFRLLTGPVSSAIGAAAK